MTLHKDDLEYFNKGRVENPRYWMRLGVMPDLKDTTVVDLGCGHGSLCIDIAQSGASRVIGIDFNSRLIDFANENLKINYPQLIDRVEFRCQDLRETPECDIDFFVSKDTFEHVIGLAQIISEMKKRLKPGGRIYTGFGPLWNSVFGDHGRTKIMLPWGHTIFTEQFLIKWHNRFDTQKATSISDLGLNSLSLTEYLRIFSSSGMTIVFLKFNASKHPVSRLFSLARRIPFLEEYFTHQIYCILQKDSE